MKALVTGAAGFIGSHVAEWLLRDGIRVHILHRRLRYESTTDDGGYDSAAKGPVRNLQNGW